MKQVLLLGIVTCTTAAVFISIAFTVNLNARGSDFSKLTLANVEALASGENGSKCKCGCTGEKAVSSYGDYLYCKSENDYCCCDEKGCSS